MNIAADSKKWARLVGVTILGFFQVPAHLFLWGGMYVPLASLFSGQYSTLQQSRIVNLCDVPSEACLPEIGELVVLFVLSFFFSTVLFFTFFLVLKEKKWALTANALLTSLILASFGLFWVYN